MLFEAMKEVFAGLPLPGDVADLRRAYLTTFETLTGASLITAPVHIPVDWTKRENGGMSNGFVSRDYWRETMLPEMIRRFEQRQQQ